MRIAVFTNQFPSRLTFFARDMRALIRAGADVEVFTVRPIEAALWRYARQVLPAEEFPANKVHHLWIPSLGGWLRRSGSARHGAVREILKIGWDGLRFGPVPFLKAMHASIQALGWMRHDWDRFDHLHSYWGNHPAICAYLVSRYAATETPFSIALRAHDLFYNHVYLAEKIRQAGRVFLPGSFHLDFFQQRFPDLHRVVGKRLAVSAPGVDLDEFSYDPTEPEEHTLVAVGRLELEKGHRYLLQAVQRLRQEGVSVRLRLVGEGAERKRLERLARNFGIADRVDFTGWLYADEAKGEIKNGTVLVHPSSGLDSEPNTIKEAHALGTPVVGTAVAGIPEMLDHGRCGLIVPPADVEALTGALQRYIDDPSLRRSHAERARKLCEKRYDMWENGRRFKELLESTQRREIVLGAKP